MKLALMLASTSHLKVHNDLHWKRESNSVQQDLDDQPRTACRAVLVTATTSYTPWTDDRLDGRQTPLFVAAYPRLVCQLPASTLTPQLSSETSEQLMLTPLSFM